jgi:hypothetical protein
MDRAEFVPGELRARRRPSRLRHVGIGVELFGAALASSTDLTMIRVMTTPSLATVKAHSS